MIILGIETSCDETAAALIEFPDGKNILASVVASQDDVHSSYGGIVPELASRRHMEVLVPLVFTALKRASVSLKDLEGIAVTRAPGLVGSLLVGVEFAKGLALSLKKPLIGVNHLEGHLNAIAIETDVPYPHVGLVVSGGHTSLYHVEDFGRYRLLGATRDDAAGEAFDKAAKLLNLGYPGGPAIEKISQYGNPNAMQFKTPHFRPSERFKISELDFSFSGIKTAVLISYKNAVHNGAADEKFVADLAASFQLSVVNILCERLMEAAEKTKARAILISGGVAANKLLRLTLQERCKEVGIRCLIPSVSLCTDNAAMIAYVGAKHLANGEFSAMDINAIANMEIGVSCIDQAKKK